MNYFISLTALTTFSIAFCGVIESFSPFERSTNSTFPSDIVLPTVTQNGNPIKSASLNLTPGRSFLSSNTTSTPAFKSCS